MNIERDSRLDTKRRLALISGIPGGILLFLGLTVVLDSSEQSGTQDEAIETQEVGNRVICGENIQVAIRGTGSIKSVGTPNAEETKYPNPFYIPTSIDSTELCSSPSAITTFGKGYMGPIGENAKE